MSVSFTMVSPGAPETSPWTNSGRKRDALGWVSAAELSWAPGTEGAPSKWAALQRDGSAQEQLLCTAQQG